jgi:hypothetical protein
MGVGRGESWKPVGIIALSRSGRQVADRGWRLMSQTNALATGLSGSWTQVQGVTDGSASITIDPTKPAVFYKLQYP